jgi:hypothetical protein
MLPTDSSSTESKWWTSSFKRQTRSSPKGRTNKLQVVERQKHHSGKSETDMAFTVDDFYEKPAAMVQSCASTITAHKL